jgi:hypothetical protein
MDNYIYEISYIWTACNLCNESAYKILEMKGVDLHQVDNQKRSLLHAIASGNNPQCISIADRLIRSGVRYEDKDVLGHTVFDNLNAFPFLHNTHLKNTTILDIRIAIRNFLQTKKTKDEMGSQTQK